MGRYDDISDERLRAEVARFARILQRMEERGETLDRTADILKLLGELRRMVFAWEVRCTFQQDHDVDEDRPRGAPEPRDLDQAMTLSERIVAEARRREQELRDEFERRDEPESDAE